MKLCIGSMDATSMSCGLTDRPDMTLDVTVDVKEQHNNNNSNFTTSDRLML